MAARRRWHWLIIALALSLLAVACGDSDTEATTTEGTDNEPTTTAPDDEGEDTTSTTAEPSAEVESLTVAIRQTGEVYDPTTNLPSEISAVTGNVINWLWERNPDGSLAPGLVEEWEYAPDPVTLNLKLREGVKFHDGSDFTAEDVVFSWERHVEAEFASRVARTLTELEIVDEHNMILHFEQPEVSFMAGAGFPIVSKTYHDTVGEEEFLANPVGTGPYQITEIAPGEHVDLERFDDYWGEAPEVASVRMRLITDDQTRMSALETGEIDMAMQIPFQLAESVAETEGLTTTELRPGGFTTFIAYKYQTDETPWSDPRVREAMSIAIDRDAIVNDILDGVPESYPFLAPSDLGYNPGLEHYEYDPERAQQLLADAGYPDGFQVQLPYISGALTGLQETAEAVALYWNQVGIQASPMPLEGGQFVGFVLGASNNPEQDYVGLFVSALAGQPEPTVGLVSQFSSVTPFAWYRNEQVNGIVLGASVQPDREQRAGMIMQAGQLIKADHGFTPLWTAVQVFGHRECLEFTPTLSNIDLFLIKDVSTANCAG